MISGVFGVVVVVMLKRVRTRTTFISPTPTNFDLCSVVPRGIRAPENSPDPCNMAIAKDVGRCNQDAYNYCVEKKPISWAVSTLAIVQLSKDVA